MPYQGMLDGERGITVETEREYRPARFPSCSPLDTASFRNGEPFVFLCLVDIRPIHAYCSFVDRTR